MKKAKLLMRMVSVAMTAAMFTQAMITGAVAKDIEAKTTGTTYYVDSTSGNDENNGTSENAPWKSLEKVNSTVFQPGDQILFKTGSRYEGQLAPQGSGEEGAPIIINMYGDGEEKPIIDGMGREGDRTILDNDGAAIVLQNQDYWEINNLEVTNQSDKMGERFGILIRWHNYGTGEHVYIKDCYIHDISGMYQNGVTEYEEDGSVVNKNRFMGDGIMVVATGTPESEGGVPTNFNDILIEGNRLEEIYRTGITIWSQWTDRPGAPLYYPGADGKLTFHSTVGKYVANTNVIVRENQLDTMAGDGILINTCDGALVEYNTVANCNYYSKSDPNAGVWPHNSDNTIMQYNEVYGTRTTADGQSFDVDMNCDNTIIQYNYSHDNEGGFLLIMHDAHNITVRYNISENDGCGLFDWRGYDTRVYNNTFYMTSPLYRTVSGSGELYNNIFYSSEENKAQDWKSMTYKNNCYYNFANTPNDSNAVTAAPLLSAPGAGNVDGYQLSENSPCINGGLFMQNNGGLDYFGNQLDDVPDMGAADTQTAGEAKYEINYAFNCPVTVSDSLEGWGWSSQYLTDGNFGSGNILGWTTNSRESVNEDHFAEIDLGKVVPINKLVLTNSGGAFPADFTISVYQDETQKWKQVVTETGYEAHSPESKIPETFGLEEAVYGSKVRIDITKLTQKSDGIYAQIGEFEVYYIDKIGLGETIAKVEENSELVEALGEILNTAKEVYKKPVGEVTYTELLQQQTLLDKLMQMYTQDPLRFTLNVKIQEMKSILENDVDAWGPAKTMFEETISWASKIVNDNEASEEEIEKSVKALESALEDFQSAEDYSYTNIVDDFENWNYMYQKGETIFLEPANATNGGRNSVMSNPASSEENYLVYKINKLKSISFLNALPRGFSDTEPIRLYVSSNNDTYISLENVQVEEITEQIPKRKYTCTDIPENMNYLKIELPDGYPGNTAFSM